MRKIAISALLLAGACNNFGSRQADELSCKPDLVDPPALSTLATWRPSAWPVNVRGIYTKWSPQDVPGDEPDLKWLIPTEIDIARDLHLRPGDYVGLKTFGRFYYRWQSGPDSTTGNMLGAVFVDAKGHFLSPAKAGQEQAFITQPTYFGNLPTDVPQDFFVPADQETIVRVPAGAVKLKFEVNDSAYNDNRPAGDFGVWVYEPNREYKGSGPSPRLLPADSEEVGSLFSAEDMKRIASAAYPTAKAFAASPFAGGSNADSAPQWRGNYEGSGWARLRSTYSGQRTGGRHWGWDIFSPKGTPLVAPVWPSSMIVPADDSVTFGKTVGFAFKWKNQKFLLAYAHLDRVVGADRSIAGPELVAYSGCTGNVPTSKLLPFCGAVMNTAATQGTRNDHVHVGLYRNLLKPADQDTNVCNPAYVLNWTIK